MPLYTLLYPKTDVAQIILASVSKHWLPKPYHLNSCLFQVSPNGCCAGAADAERLVQENNSARQKCVPCRTSQPGAIAVSAKPNTSTCVTPPPPSSRWPTLCSSFVAAASLNSSPFVACWVYATEDNRHAKFTNRTSTPTITSKKRRYRLTDPQLQRTRPLSCCWKRFATVDEWHTFMQHFFIY